MSLYKRFVLPIAYNNQRWMMSINLLNNLLTVEDVDNFVKEHAKNDNAALSKLNNDVEYLSFVKRNLTAELPVPHFQFATRLEAHSKFQCIIEAMKRLVNSCEHLFCTDSYSLPVLQQNNEMSITLSRDQIGSLMAQMALCLMIPQSHNKFWSNFSIWYQSDLEPAKGYTHCLLDYFDAFSKLPPNDLTFSRRILKHFQEWEELEVPLKRELLEAISTGAIGDHDEIEVVFANQDVGFGQTGTQEEIVFGTYPEICPAVLFMETLGPNESLVISGVRRFGIYTGYGLDLKYLGIDECVLDATKFRRRTLTFMDALDLTEFISELSDSTPEDDHDRLLLLEQLKSDNILRELNKAYCAFDFKAKESDSTSNCSEEVIKIGTGHWGCGAFGGNKELKAILQLLAATRADVDILYYYCRSELFQSRLRLVYDHLISQKLRILDVMVLLFQFRENIMKGEIKLGFSVFDFLLSQ